MIPIILFFQIFFVALFNNEGLYCLFALFSGTSYTLVQSLTKDKDKIILVMLFNAIIMMVYDFIILNYVGLPFRILNIIICIISLIKSKKELTVNKKEDELKEVYD